MTPTANSLALLRRSGYTATVCESWIPHVNRRRDLFGIGDVVAIHAHRQPAVMLIQATSLSNLPARVAKAKNLSAVKVLLAAGVAVECWGWARRDGKWAVKRVAIQSADMADVVVSAPQRRRKQAVQPELFDRGEP